MGGLYAAGESSYDRVNSRDSDIRTPKAVVRRSPTTSGNTYGNFEVNDKGCHLSEGTVLAKRTRSVRIRRYKYPNAPTAMDMGAWQGHFSRLMRPAFALQQQSVRKPGPPSRGSLV